LVYIDIFSNDYRIAFMYGAVTLVIALLFVLPIKRGEALMMDDASLR